MNQRTAARQLVAGIAEQPGDVVVHLDRKGRITHWSDEAVKVFGYGPEEVLGRPLEFVCPLADGGPDRARFDVARVMAGRDFAGGFQCHRKDGDRLALYVYATAGRDPAGAVAGVVCIAREVTQFWRAEQAIRVSEEKYGLLFGSTSDAVVFLSRRGRIVDANPAAARMSGYPRDKLIGMLALDLIPAERRRDAIAAFRRLMREHRLTEALEFETGDGKRLTVEITASAIVTEGQPFYFAIGRDVSTRVRAERAVRESAEKYRRIFAAVRDGMYLETLDGAILDVNDAACRLLGYTREELLQKRIEDLVPEEVSASLDLVRDALLKQGQFVGEAVNIRRDGSEVPVDISASLLELGGQTLALVTARDATARQAAARALRESEANFRALADNANDGILIAAGPQARHAYVNRRATEITGYSEVELLTMGPRDLAHPDDLAKVLDRYRRRLRGEAVPTHYEVRLRRKDGSVAFIELAAARTEWQGESADLIVVRDITERERAERELREMADTAIALARLPAGADVYDFVASRLPGLVGDAVFGVNVYDPEQDILRVYRLGGIEPAAFEQVSALAGTDISQLAFHCIPAAVKERLASGKLVRVEGGLEAILFGLVPGPACREVEQVLGVSEAYSVGLRHGDVLFGNITILPRRGAEPGASLVEAFASEVSVALERQAASRALGASEERYRALFELAPDAVAVHQDGRLIAANPAAVRMLGYQSAAEMVGRPVLEFVHPDDRAKAAGRIRDALEKGRPAPLAEERFQRRDGDYIRVEVAAVPLAWHGRPAMLVAARNITERRRLAEKVEDLTGQMRAMFDRSPHGIMVEDKGVVVYANQVLVELLDYERTEDLTGRAVADFIAPEDQEKMADNARRRLAGKTAPSSYTYRALRRDGSVVELANTVSVYMVDGKPYIISTKRPAAGQGQPPAAGRDADDTGNDRARPSR